VCIENNNFSSRSKETLLQLASQKRPNTSDLNTRLYSQRNYSPSIIFIYNIPIIDRYFLLRANFLATK